MSGPVSDSYDPEFSTGQNARDIRDAIGDIVATLEHGPLRDKPVEYILEVVHGKAGRLSGVTLSEKQWRIVRFALNRAIETL